MQIIRIIVIALVAANLLLLGLAASRPQPGVTEVPINVPAQAPRLVVLSELDTHAGGPEQCFTVGPFETAETTNAISGLLEEYASSIQTRKTEAFVDRGFWVYLLPFQDLVTARAAVAAMFDAGIDGTGVIRNGEWDLSVSLGYFIDQDNAIARRDRARALGFDAQMRIQRDDESRFWVDYRQRTGVEYASRVLDDIVPPELHRETACSSPATPAPESEEPAPAA